MREGWTYKELGEVASFTSGSRPSGGVRAITHGVLSLGGEHIGKNGYIDLTTPKYVSEKYYLDNNKGHLCDGDILLCKDGALSGKVALVRNELQGVAAMVNEHVFIIRTNAIYQPFLFTFLFSSISQTELKSRITGAAQGGINGTNLKTVIVPIPPLSEQERIVSELDLLSGIIEKKKAQLKEYDQLAQSIFYDMFGDPIENERGWEATTIGECCVLKSGNSDANNSSLGSLPYVKVGDMNIVGNETYINTSSTFVDREENKKDIFPIGTTIFPKRGGAILTNKKRITNVEICCDLNVMGVIPNKERLHPLYIYFYFLKIDFVIFGKTGSTIPQINNHNIAPMRIGVPPLSLQQSFASKIEAIEQQKELIKQSITDTETLFNSRMDYWFN